MTLSITHTKHNNETDWTQADLNAQIALGFYPAGTVLADITLPSDWNNALTTSMATGKLVGRSTAGTGVFEELSVGSGLSLSGGTLSSTVTAQTTSNSDGSITVATGTTNPVVSLNVAHANTFTALQTYNAGITLGKTGASEPVNFIGPTNAINGALNWTDTTGAFGGTNNRLTLSSSSGAGTAQLIAGQFTPPFNLFFDVFGALGASAFGNAGPFAVLVAENTSDNGIGGTIFLGSDTGVPPGLGYMLASMWAVGNGDGTTATANPFMQVYTADDWSLGTGNGVTIDFLPTIHGGSSSEAALRLQADGLVVVNPLGAGSGFGAPGLLVVATDGSNVFDVDAVGKTVGFFNATPVAQQTDGAALTNNVTSGGTTDTIENYTSLTLYATDAAAIRNNIYQLARKVKIIDDALRAYGLLT